MKLVSILLLSFSILVLIASFGFYFLFNTQVNSFELYSNVSISDNAGIGINLDSSTLTFGELGHGGSSLRKVTLTNDYDFPLLIKVNSVGDISPLLSYESVKYLPPLSNISIPITAFSFEEPVGFYEGNITFKLFRTTNKLFND